MHLAHFDWAFVVQLLAGLDVLLTYQILIVIGKMMEKYGMVF